MVEPNNMVVVLNKSNVPKKVEIIAGRDEVDEDFPEIHGILQEMANAGVLVSHSFRSKYDDYGFLGEGTYGIVREYVDIDTEQTVAEDVQVGNARKRHIHRHDGAAHPAVFE